MNQKKVLKSFNHKAEAEIVQRNDIKAFQNRVSLLDKDPPYLQYSNDEIVQFLKNKRLLSSSYLFQKKIPIHFFRLLVCVCVIRANVFIN